MTRDALEELVRGFIAGQHTHLEISVSRWVEGEPEPSFFMGTRAPNEKSLHVTTYRCIACGFLESYALREHAEK